MSQPVKGQWFTLPSGKVAEVCRLTEVRLPRYDGDAGPTFTMEVMLRFLNSDGAMASAGFTVTLEFIVKHCKRVDVTPTVGV